jgi:glutathione S-transferase
MTPISEDHNNEGAGTMIVVHHLNNSRSQRILWLLEELNTPYRVETYRRDAKTTLKRYSMMAPDSASTKSPS